MLRMTLAALAALLLTSGVFLHHTGVKPASATPAKTTARTAPGTLVASRALLAKLEANGRAVATVEHAQPDPFGEGTRRQKGTLAIEPPDRTRLDFASGEAVALRSDGGEWLQPELGQMLRMNADHAAAARQWWSLLLPGASSRFSERALGKSRYLVIAKDGSSADSAWVTLGANALPAALQFRGVDGEMVEVKFLAWSFARPRGPAAFVLAAPAGVNVIEMP